MRLGTAIERLVDNYRYASDKDWIMDKVAWALYQTWKEADRKTENSSEKPNNCEKDCFLCKWLGDVDVCGRCRSRNLFAEADIEPKPKDEPQTNADQHVQHVESVEQTEREGE